MVRRIEQGLWIRIQATINAKNQPMRSDSVLSPSAALPDDAGGTSAARVRPAVASTKTRGIRGLEARGGKAPTTQPPGSTVRIDDYLELARASYESEPERHVSNKWSVRKSEQATWYGNGFQGAVFESDKEIVVGFCGTKGFPLHTPISQNAANVRIGAFIIPNVAGPAMKLVRWAEENSGGKPISIVGHSLGGALAQVVGTWSGRPFVSFNGPGMAVHLKASTFNVFKPRQMARSIDARKKDAPAGLCFNVQGDFIGAYGKWHIGEVRPLTLAPGQPTHGIAAVNQALSLEDLAKRPWMLSADWPAPRISDTPPVLPPLRWSGPSLEEMIVQHPAFRRSSPSWNLAGSGARNPVRPAWQFSDAGPGNDPVDSLLPPAGAFSDRDPASPEPPLIPGPSREVQGNRQTERDRQRRELPFWRRRLQKTSKEHPDRKTIERKVKEGENAVKQVNAAEAAAQPAGAGDSTRNTRHAAGSLRKLVALLPGQSKHRGWGGRRSNRRVAPTIA